MYVSVCGTPPGMMGSVIMVAPVCSAMRFGTFSGNCGSRTTMGTCSAFIEAINSSMWRGGRIDARLQFNRAEVVHAEALREVWPMLVIGYELHALERFGFLLPLGNLGVELGEIGIAVAREFRLILRGERHQRVVDVLDRGLCQHRVEHVVRVAVGMNVALGVIG